jgi:RNA polymerase sigma-70 factor (ECF subfamily)
MLGQPEDAKEASQETFLRVYQGLARFNGRYQLGPWITRIATNVCLDQLRSRQRKPSQAMPIEDFLRFEPATEAVPEPEAVVIRNFESRRVRKVLESLPPTHRAAIVLRDFEGLSYSEVAAVLGVTECQVKALIHRARKGFRRSWTGSLAALIPFRFMTRHPDSFEKSQGLSGSAGSLAQVASSCSVALQQCGQYVTERAAGVVTAALIGGVAAAGAVSAHDAGSLPPLTTARVVRSTNEHKPVARDHPRARNVRRATTDVASRPSMVPTIVPTPAPSDTPTAPPADPGSSDGTSDGSSGSDSDGSVPDGTSTPPDSQSPSPDPEPSGFTFSFDPGSDAPSSCSCAGATWVTSQNVVADADQLHSSDQQLSGSAGHGGLEYGLSLRQSVANGYAHDLSFVLRTADGTYTYSGSGHVVAQTTTAWGGRTYLIAGTYDLTGRPGRDEQVPVHGEYTEYLTVSLTRQSVVSESFKLTEQ